MTTQNILAGLLVLIAVAMVIFRLRKIVAGKGGCGCCGMKDECSSSPCDSAPSDDDAQTP